MWRWILEPAALLLDNMWASNCLNKTSAIVVPRGFAHGFVVLEDDTIFAYKVDIIFPENDRDWLFDDPSLAIDWLVDKEQLQLSAKDTRQPTLDNAELFDNASSLYA